MDRIDTDGSRAPVQCWLAQGVGEQMQLCSTLLVPCAFHDPAPVSRYILRLFRKRQLAGSTCSLAPADRAPYTFFANRCPRKGNGSIDLLDMAYDPALPMLLWARWRISAHAPPAAGPVRFFCQEPRTVEPGGQAERHYPGREPWHCLPGYDVVQRPCEGYIHLRCGIAPLSVAPVELPMEPSDGRPVYRSSFWDLPVEEVVERHLDARGGRSKSVLTFDRTKKPW